MKKLSIYAVAIMTIVWSLGLAVNVPTASAAYAPVVGDLIKTATDSGVYYIDTGNKRRLYVNAVTFWTWNTGTWSNIKNTNGVAKTIQTISQTDFDNLAMGLNITARPGARIIKFQNSPKIYTVSATAQLALLNDATAKSLFGDNWSAKVIVIQNGFENDYTKKTNCSDLACFLEAAKTCTPVQGIYVYNNQPLLNFLMSGRTEMEIKKGENSMCVFYQKFLEASVKYSDDLVQSLLDQGKTMAEIKSMEAIGNSQQAMTIGKNITCTMTIDNLVAKISSNSLSTQNPGCVGTLYDLTDELNNQ